MNRLLLAFLLVMAGLKPARPQAAAPSATDAHGSGVVGTVTDHVFDYLEMAGSQHASSFHPLSQQERNAIFTSSLVNPLWYLKGTVSGAQDQKNDKPREWDQGVSGYAKRVGNIMGQYAVQRAVTFGLSSLLREDNRYFGSGKKGFWSRSGYALSSGVLARHDNGRRYPSLSQVSGFAAGAFVSRLWQPPGSNSARDGAVSFGISLGYHLLSCEVKEFLPDILRALTKKDRSHIPLRKSLSSEPGK